MAPLDCCCHWEWVCIAPCGQHVWCTPWIFWATSAASVVSMSSRRHKIWTHSLIPSGLQVVEACGATLIVCPAPILHQWRDEICRHVTPGTLSVGLYHGQLQPGGLEMVVVQGAAAGSKGTAGKGLQVLAVCHFGTGLVD